MNWPGGLQPTITLLDTAGSGGGGGHRRNFTGLCTHDMHLLVVKDEPPPANDKLYTLTGRVATLLLSHDMYLLASKDRSPPPLLQTVAALYQSSGIVLSSF